MLAEGGSFCLCRVILGFGIYYVLWFHFTAVLFHFSNPLEVTEYAVELFENKLNSLMEHI